MSGNHPRLILDGIKTQTRRVAKDIEDYKDGYPDGYDNPPQSMIKYKGKWIDDGDFVNDFCPYGQVGDRLWARETWRVDRWFNNLPSRYWLPQPKHVIDYKATPDTTSIVSCVYGKWRPSIFMPRWASRITLEITGVRVERVQEITEEDARAEGVEKCEGFRIYPQPKEFETVNDYRMGFTLLWDSLNAKRGYSWESNCWVWVINFKRV